MLFTNSSGDFSLKFGAMESKVRYVAEDYFVEIRQSICEMDKLRSSCFSR
jgi:hypothetical protein